MDDLNETGNESRSQRWSFISWPLILVIAFLIFEVTNDPAFAALAMCLKFGWEDFRTARWLRKTDPDRGRGKACFWLFNIQSKFRGSATPIFFAPPLMRFASIAASPSVTRQNSLSWSARK